MSAQDLEKAIQRVLDGEPSGCQCDFCSGKKKLEDNWCSYCGNVQMQPPKHWENEDVCDACDEKLKCLSMLEKAGYLLTDTKTWVLPIGHMPTPEEFDALCLLKDKFGFGEVETSMVSLAPHPGR